MGNILESIFCFLKNIHFSGAVTLEQSPKRRGNEPYIIWRQSIPGRRNGNGTNKVGLLEN